MNRIEKQKLFIIFYFFVFIQIVANTYYVDSSFGNDSSTGTSIFNPWQTITKINNYSFHAGDSILFKKGEVWKEYFDFSSSGNAFYPIVIGSYGEGDRSYCHPQFS